MYDSTPSKVSVSPKMSWSILDHLGLSQAWDWLITDVLLSVEHSSAFFRTHRFYLQYKHKFNTILIICTTTSLSWYPHISYEYKVEYTTLLLVPIPDTSICIVICIDSATQYWYQHWDLYWYWYPILVLALPSVLLEIPSTGIGIGASLVRAQPVDRLFSHD